MIGTVTPSARRRAHELARRLNDQALEQRPATAPPPSSRISARNPRRPSPAPPRCCAVVSTSRLSKASTSRGPLISSAPRARPYRRRGPAACRSRPSTARRQKPISAMSFGMRRFDAFDGFIDRRQAAGSLSPARQSASRSSSISGSSRGPSPSTNQTFRPSASGTTRMSENRIAASSGKRRSGCITASVARAGE